MQYLCRSQDSDLLQLRQMQSPTDLAGELVCGYHEIVVKQLG